MDGQGSRSLMNEKEKERTGVGDVPYPMYSSNSLILASSFWSRSSMIRCSADAMVCLVLITVSWSIENTGHELLP